MSEHLLYLIPTSDEEWALLENADVGDMAPHIRCIECQQSDFISYYISHKPECKTAMKIAASIESLPEEKKRERRVMEKYL